MLIGYLHAMCALIAVLIFGALYEWRIFDGLLSRSRWRAYDSVVAAAAWMRQQRGGDSSVEAAAAAWRRR